MLVGQLPPGYTDGSLGEAQAAPEINEEFHRIFNFMNKLSYI